MTEKRSPVPRRPCRRPPAGAGRARALLGGVLGLLLALPALGYPEFEVWIEETSGRYVDCAFCHTHPDGPEGVKPGQIRSLSPEELDRLNEARSAFEPGAEVDSPVLNDFGDRIMEVLGKHRVLEIRSTDPGLLAEELGRESDLDGDSIPDAVEYAEGTHPLDARHGDPWKLFVANVGRAWLDLLMITLATLFGLYGLNHLLAWFTALLEGRQALEEERRRTSTFDYLAGRARRR